MPQLRDVEAERDRLAARVAAVEGQLAEQAQRATQAEQALQEQVGWSKSSGLVRIW